MVPSNTHRSRGFVFDYKLIDYDADAALEDFKKSPFYE